MRAKTQIDELIRIKRQVNLAFAILMEVENDLPAASTSFEMALDEGYEAIQWMVMDLETLGNVLEGIIKEHGNAKA